MSEVGILRLKTRSRRLTPEERGELERLALENMAALRMLTLDDVAEAFQSTREQVKTWVARGCPCVNLRCMPATASHAHLRFCFAEVKRWLESFSSPF